MNQKLIYIPYVYDLKVHEIIWSDTDGNMLVVVHTPKESELRGLWFVVDSKTCQYLHFAKTKKKLLEEMYTFNLYDRYLQFISNHVNYKKALEKSNEWLSIFKEWTGDEDGEI